MINKIKQYLETRPNLISIVGIIFIFSVIVISSIITSKTVTKKDNVPVIDTLPTPTPYLEDPLINPDQILSITGWENIKITSPIDLPVYQINQPLVAPELIMKVSELLGFVSQEKQKSLLKTSYLWSNEKQYLFASTLDRTISYQLTEIPRTGTLPESNEAVAISQNFINQLFPQKDLTFKQYKKVNYLKQNDASYYVSASQSTGDFAEVTFTQEINNYQLLGNTHPQGVINFLINRQKQISAFKINSGFQKTVSLASIKITPLDQTIETAPKLARRIFTDSPETDEGSILSSEKLNFNLTNVFLSYYPYSRPDILEPVYILEGDLSGKQISTVQATYVIPASPY